jgi:hypothetical protein
MVSRLISSPTCPPLQYNYITSSFKINKMLETIPSSYSNIDNRNFPTITPATVLKFLFNQRHKCQLPDLESTLVNTHDT